VKLGLVRWVFWGVLIWLGGSGCSLDSSLRSSQVRFAITHSVPQRDFDQVSAPYLAHVYQYDYACVEIFDEDDKQKIGATEGLPLQKSMSEISAQFSLPRLKVGNTYTLHLYGLPSKEIGCATNESKGIIKQEIAHGTYEIPQRPGEVPLISEFTGWHWTTYVKKDSAVPCYAAVTTDKDMGRSVAIDGTTMIVGVPGCNPDVSTSKRGVVLVYEKNSRTDQWEYPSTLTPPLDTTTSPGPDFNLFGDSLGISGDTIVVGALASKVNGKSRAGAVWVFEKNGSSWAGPTVTPLISPDPTINGEFGTSVSIDGDTIVVGAPGEEGGKGSAYVFKKSGTVWTPAPIVPSPQLPLQLGDQFGFSVSIVGGRIAVGAPSQSYEEQGIINDLSTYTAPPTTHSEVGGVYVFEELVGTWTNTAYLNVPHFNQKQTFGYSVAFDRSGNDVLVVGARGENNNSAPVEFNAPNVQTSLAGGPSPSPGAPEGRGAAYIFKYDSSRSGWVVDAYLKAPNLDEYGVFGTSVAIHEGKVVIGAPLERSNSTVIVNGTMPTNPPDPAVTGIGGVYVFGKEDSGSWKRAAYLKAPNSSSTNPSFGKRVAIYQNTIVVGVPQDDTNVEGVSSNRIFWKEPGFNVTAPTSKNSGAAYVFEYAQVGE